MRHQWWGLCAGNVDGYSLSLYRKFDLKIEAKAIEYQHNVRLLLALLTMLLVKIA